MKQSRSSFSQPWLNLPVLGIALASLFSDWSHEIATAVLPAFLGSLGAAAAWLGIIECVSDGLSSFAKLGSGFYTDRLPRSKPIAFAGYLVTALLRGWPVRFPSARALKRCMICWQGCSLAFLTFISTCCGCTMR